MEHNHHHHSHSANSREELVALMKYMVAHNASHTKELAKLMDNLADVDTDAQALVKEATAKFEEGNDLLSQALSKLTEE